MTQFWKGVCLLLAPLPKPIVVWHSTCLSNSGTEIQIFANFCKTLFIQYRFFLCVYKIQLCIIGCHKFLLLPRLVLLATHYCIPFFIVWKTNWWRQRRCFYQIRKTTFLRCTRLNASWIKRALAVMQLTSAFYIEDGRPLWRGHPTLLLRLCVLQGEAMQHFFSLKCNQ